MPVYNEAECIESVVRSWASEFSRQFQSSYRFIVVNDGSKDSTPEILDHLATELGECIQVIHQKNGGHGSALITGYQAALNLGAEWIFQTDSDDQFLPSDFEKLWQLRHTSAFLLGHRFNRQDAAHRKLISKLMRIVLFLVYQVWITDPNIPFRLIRRDFFVMLWNELPKSVFAPNIFLSILAARKTKVPAIAVHHRDRKTGQVSIIRMSLVKACLRSFKELILFRLKMI
jgi:glycosyltransferase involved in cell wall biosynthesis